jgi:hypothetical protein
MVGPGGAATLTYDDGCTVTVQPGSVTTIAPLSPCAAGSYAQQTGNNQNGYGQPGYDNGPDWGGIALGGAAIGLAGFGGYEAFKKTSNGAPPIAPVSPP